MKKDEDLKSIMDDIYKIDTKKIPPATVPQELDENGKLYYHSTKRVWWPIEKDSPQQRLWDLLSEFIQAHEIKTPDTIVLHNIHLQHGFKLLADICDIVGWHKE